MSSIEAQLLQRMPDGLSYSCEPRRTDLPDEAQAGIDCRIDDPLVARIGLYQYESPLDATGTYLDRMSLLADVEPMTGDCESDLPGDSGWSNDGTDGVYMPDSEGPPADPFGYISYDEWEWYTTRRVGCFLNEDGVANARAACGNVYVGILGRKGDLSDLMVWAFARDPGEDPNATWDRIGWLREDLCYWDTSRQ